MQINYLN